MEAGPGGSLGKPLEVLWKFLVPPTAVASEVCRMGPQRRDPMPSQPPPPPDEFQLGEWRVRRDEGSVSSPQRTIRLEPRVMDVLMLLARHPGRVVPKEEILETVWPDAVVEEGALPQCIHSIRKALGDSARQPRYIQTVPKRGYRLLVEIDAETTEDAGGPAPEDERPPAGRWHRWARAGAVWMAVALFAGALAWYQREARPDRVAEAARQLQPQTSTADRPIRVVVLPFENLGEPEDTYFADGLTEEITKDLASMASLQVISRTTAVQYAASRRTVQQIGEELDVHYVLEGTVRWAGGSAGPRVRVTPQLIRVADDAHVWAHAFELEIDDIFRVQAEISQRVIGMLGISLLPPERQSLMTPPTASLEAYRAYLRGLELKNQPFYSESHLRRAVSMFERAVAFDDDFAAAWAELSQTHSYLAFNSDRSPERVAEAYKSLERARALQAELPATRLASAYYSYRCLEDFDRALEELTAAAAVAPNHAEILRGLGFVLRRLGRLAEAAQYLRRSFAVDPRTIKVVWALAETYRALRQHEEADTFYRQAISLAPDQPFFWEERIRNRLAWTGSTEAAREILGKAPIGDDAGLLTVKTQLDLFDRDFRGVLTRFASPKLADVATLDRCQLASIAVVAHERGGDPAGARELAEQNRAALARLVDRFPREAFFRAYLAVALAHLGRGDEAVAQGDAAVAQKAGDSFTGPRIVELRARVDVALGRHEEAVGRLESLLSKHYQLALTLTELALDPAWDPLREDKRFEALLRRYAASEGPTP